MAGNSRVVLLNYATDATTIIKNGTGGGAPALDETTGYGMAGALLPDRYSPWTTSASPASPINFDFDLGSAKSISCAWVSGIRYFDATKDLASITIKGHASAYSASASGYTTLGTVTIPAVTAQGMAPRDAGVTFGAASIRYLRFTLTFRGSAGRYSIGKLGVGPIVDLGSYYGAGSTDSPFRYQQVARTIAGHPEILDYGDQGREIRLTFPTAVAAGTIDATLPLLAELPGSFIYVDPSDAVYEVRLADSRVSRSRVFASLNAYQLDLERLP